MDEQHTCEHCGEPGAVLCCDYVGGIGYVDHYLCSDAVACWHRWDVQHGFAPADKQKKAVA